MEAKILCYNALMTNQAKTSIKKFCSDKNGKLVLGQSPNLPIIGWIAFKAASIPVSDQRLKTGLESVATSFLFVWAYLEITEGDSNFRKLLGAVIMSVIILNMLV